MTPDAFGSRYDGPSSDRIHLLIVQPTPFCNIQCDYCYLPERDLTHRLTRKTFRTLLEKVMASGLVGNPTTLVWHAGEPLVLPVSYYRDLVEEIEQLGISRSKLRQSVQTNALLVSDRWCEFIREQEMRIGVSIDGPAFLHDRHRKDRQGNGTHGRAMRGIERLRAHQIDFHAIAVITADSLPFPDEIFDFFLNLGVRMLGFNVEEQEGVNEFSSLGRRGIEARVRKFWRRIYERFRQAGGAIKIREFVRAFQTIKDGHRGMSADLAMRENSQTAPFAIVSADWQGNLSTFSPELLGAKSVDYGDFAFGNIHEMDLPGVGETAKFQRIASDIYEGVKNCERSCPYFALCGGGAPSNKYFETGSFTSSETMFCRTSIQIPIEIMLADLEKQFGLAGGQTA